MSKKKPIERTLLVRLDEYIEFAKERKCFSDFGFYNAIKTEIGRLTSELKAASGEKQ